MTMAQSRKWAKVLLNPYTRCAICGLPNYMIEVYRKVGPWPYFLGRSWGKGSHPTLNLDHVTPGDNKGRLRPLCSACNTRRGAARFTDAQVLVWIMSKWRDYTALRFLWWLNTTPGEGGTLHRSPSCEKRDARYAAGKTSGKVTVQKTRTRTR